MNDIVREFLVESHENLAQLDLDLVTLEKEPGERETLARVFRTVHTVKGTAGFLGLAKLQAVGHAGENVLSRVRAGELTFSADIATALLGAVDAIRKMLAALEASGTEGDGDYTELIHALDKLTSASAPRGRAPKVAQEEAPAPAQPPVARAPGAPLTTPVPTPEPADARAPAVSDSNIRVDVELLDKLMTLVGELVLARNQIVQFSGTQEDTRFLGTVQRLNVLTSELQVGVMKTRMQPIGTVWAKFPRIVRDLARACDKHVRLDMEGQETELDRTIIEAIRDPLTHIVRNSIDHGIELAPVRVARGKLAEGRLRLRAFHESGKVVIEVDDDGGGIDAQRVREKAVSAKLVAPEQAARMTDAELFNLIFLPGFSTTDRVTHFSGRGVGMDVVRTHIEKIGGTVDVESRPGQGTTIKMKIPLTLAIVQALIITAAGDRYAIPQVNLLELVRLEGEQLTNAIEYVHGAPVYRLRGNLLPLVYLNREFGFASARPDASEVNLIVLQANELSFGLVVDEIHDTEEIVVKPLQKQVKGPGVFAGATILGDGQVALILDVLGLAHRARVTSGPRERARPDTSAVAPATKPRPPVLLFATAGDGRMAVPIDRVARLEEFPRSSLETVGGAQMVQYRGAILPLIQTTHTNTEPTDDTVQVVVFAGAPDAVGLVVDRVLDIVEDCTEQRSTATRPGVLFNAVIQERITEFLDVDALVGRPVPASGFVALAST